MAETITTSGLWDSIVEITALAGPYDHGKHQALTSIQFVPGAASDCLIVREGGKTGPVLMKVTADGISDEVVKYFSNNMRHPYIDPGECTLTSGYVITLEFASRRS